METALVRLSGTRQQGEEVTHESDDVTVNGVTGVCAEEFELVIQFEDAARACDALFHILNDDREALFDVTLPSTVMEDVHGDGRVDLTSVDIDASVTDKGIAYALATRVAGQNQNDADILGETAASVEGILLDFAMSRRGGGIDGLSAAARSALLAYVIDERSDGDAGFEVAELSE